MGKTFNNQYVKRTQRDYTMSFKLSVVQEVESGTLSISEATKKYGIKGRSTVVNWIKKFGNFDRELQISYMKKKSPEQELLELRAQVEVLKRQNATMERELNNRVQKCIMFDAIVEVVKEDHNADLWATYQRPLFFSSSNAINPISQAKEKIC